MLGSGLVISRRVWMRVQWACEYNVAMQSSRAMLITSHFKRVRAEERDDVRELRELDARNREAFLAVDLKQAVVVSLQASPGAGKTTIVLDLIKRNPGLMFMLLYYNKSMREDAQARLKQAGLTNVEVFTIDTVAKRAQHGLEGAPFKGQHECKQPGGNAARCSCSNSTFTTPSLFRLALGAGAAAGAAAAAALAALRQLRRGGLWSQQHL
jgi:hypothetical protein